MIIKTLKDAVEIYQELKNINSEPTGKTAYQQLWTSLIRYTLVGMGFPPIKGKKPTPHEKEAAWEFMATIPIEKLDSLPLIQAQVFENLKVPRSTRYPYRSRLLAWCEEIKKYSGFPRSLLKPTMANRAPRQIHGHGSIRSQPVTTRKNLEGYAIKEDLYPPVLKEQIEQWERFYTTPYYANRIIEPIKDVTAKSYLTVYQRLFGWFHHYLGVPLADLSFDLLVPVVELRHVDNPLMALKESERVAEHIENWFCQYLTFMFETRDCRSHGTALKIGLAVYAMVRYQYRHQTKDPQYKDVPPAMVIQKQLKNFRVLMAQEEKVSDESLKWMDLPDIWSKIVTPLRLECACRTQRGVLRSQSAITRSFQQFVIWGCLTFRPPRRQRVFRELKMGLSCPIKPPANLAPNQVIHPLPTDRKRDANHGYLFKDVDGKWYIDLLPQSYKTGKHYGAVSLEIPNLVFNDGHCFYDYIEAYLYGYFRTPNGSWLSGGQIAETPQVEGQWYSLRMSFNPTHNFVFFKPNTTEPYGISDFGKLIKGSAHRLTGQSLNPHLLRDIYATWFLDQGYTDERIRSLAYAMGHSEKTLRQIYDSRRSQQKNRPIEEVLMELLPNYLS